MRASLAVFFVLAAAHASQIEMTPLQKVSQLLTGMLEKGKKEKQNEEVLFVASRRFCSDHEEPLAEAISDEGHTIEMLSAKVSKNHADASGLQKDIRVLSADEQKWIGNKNAATKVREIEKADFVITEKDYTESIDAVDRAKKTLEKPSTDLLQYPIQHHQVQGYMDTAWKTWSQGTSFLDMGHGLEHGLDLEYGLDLGSGKGKLALESFLKEDVAEKFSVESDSRKEASGLVVGLLNKLERKFIDEKASLLVEERHAQLAYEKLLATLDLQLNQAEQDISGKSTHKAAKLSAAADAGGDRNEEARLSKVDKHSLSDLKAACSMKATDFAARQKLRSEELMGIEKAIETLSSGSVAAHAQKHLYSLKRGTSFVFFQGRINVVQQTWTTNRKNEGKLVSAATAKLQLELQNRMVSFLRMRATQLHSRVLSAVVHRATTDPFVKVKKMLNDLLVRLMEEANDESTHKGWCDTELGTNSQTRKDKSDSVETLSAEVDELAASIAKIATDVADLTKAIAEISSTMSQATQARNEEHAENSEAIKDSQEAQGALSQAGTVLAEFYGQEAAEANSLLQQPAAYQPMQNEGGIVVFLIEDLGKSFARLEAETEMSEATAQKQYDQSMTDAKVDTASKNTAIEHKNAKKQNEKRALQAKKVDLEETQKYLDKALSYFEKLKPSCVEAGEESFDDRAQRRQEEVDSLKQALEVMSGNDLA